jgi:uncharacterized SAM-binding protein YcdF (DUF218 family)
MGMFYRIVSGLLQPYTLLVLSLLVSMLILWRSTPQRTRRLRVAVLLVGLLYLISMPLVSYLAMWSLEWPYPPLQGFPKDIDAVVILTGGLNVHDAAGRDVELCDDTALRTIHGAELYRRAGRLPIVISGGKVDPRTPGPTLARAAGDLLLQLGVDPSDLILEEQSRTTYENATCCREVLAKRNIRRIVLVTDAAHMFRASRCFRAAGLEVIPAGCRHRAHWFHFGATDLLPSTEAVSGIRDACHEWLGLAWYWIHGRL